MSLWRHLCTQFSDIISVVTHLDTWEKMASNDFLIKQGSVIEFLSSEGCSAANIYDRMKSVFGNMCISDGTVLKWVRYFRGQDPTETTVRDRKRPGRPLSAYDTVHQEAVDCMIRSDRRVKQCHCKWSRHLEEQVPNIVPHLLGYLKVICRMGPKTIDFRNEKAKKGNVYPP